jgi:hypothetical protein
MPRKTDVPEAVETPSTALVVPGTGEVVDLANPDEAALAYVLLDELGRKVRMAQIDVRRALAAHAEQYGGNTMRLPSAEVKITHPEEIAWDLEVLRELRDAGLPDARWYELVTTTVDTKVSATVAKQIARANPEYAGIIALAETRTAKNPSVSVALRADAA